MLAIVHKIIYFHNHETILFAVEELRRLIEKAGYKRKPICYKKRFSYIWWDTSGYNGGRSSQKKGTNGSYCRVQ